MLERIKAHPVSSAFWATVVFLGTLGGAWYFFTSQAPGPVLYGFIVRMASMRLLVILLIVAGLVLSLTVLGAVVWFSVQNSRRVQELIAERERHQSEMEQLLERLRAFSAAQAKLATERDQAVTALKDKKREYAMEVLERYSSMRFTGGIAPTVTIRYHTYGQDYDLAERIKGFFTQYVRWPVTLDASTNPALPRAEQFKVLLDIGMIGLAFANLVHAFSEGDLLGVPVGQRQMDRDDSQHLIVMVLPSAEAG